MNNAEKIIKASSEFFGIPVEKITMAHGIKGAKKKDVVLARQAAMVAMKQFTSMSLEAIGLCLGKRDHSTVIHAFDAVQDLEDTDYIFARQMTDFKTRVMMIIDAPVQFNPDGIDKEFQHLI